MADSLISSRAIFPAGEQRAFLEQISQKLSIADIAHIASCSERTVRDWRREKFSMPLTVVRTLARATHIFVPKNLKVQGAYEHLAKVSKMGMAAVIKKYGRIPRNEKYRQAKWDEWWASEGRFKKNAILTSKPIHKPKKNAELAEFMGIMMGDGGLSTYQAIVTLHHIDDREYAPFVASLIEKLFKVIPSINHSPKNSVNDITVSRKALAEHLHELGLPIGNKIKQQLDIPDWIKRNRKFSIACLRGLVDTDGCVFIHRYEVKGTFYSYKKLSFTSASAPLRESVYVLLRKLGFCPRMNGKDVRLDRIIDVKSYFAIVGSHNPKHWRRYENAVG